MACPKILKSVHCSIAPRTPSLGGLGRLLVLKAVHSSTPDFLTLSIRTVAVPIWVKNGIDAWTIAAGVKDGRLLRPILKGGKVKGESLSDWAVWSVVEQSAKQIGVDLNKRHKSLIGFERLRPETNQMRSGN